MKRLLPALLVLGIVSCSANEEPKKDPPKAKESAFRALTFDKALEKAREEKKVVFIDFYADWCGPCKMLDAQTFSDDAVSALLKEKTIPIKIDTDADQATAAKFGIRAMPTMVFVNAEGKVLDRIIGFVDADTFLKKAQSITSK